MYLAALVLLEHYSYSIRKECLIVKKTFCGISIMEVLVHRADGGATFLNDENQSHEEAL